MTAPVHVLRLWGPDCPTCLRPLVKAPPGQQVIVNGTPGCTGCAPRDQR